ncbi:MAG TPA: nucleotidyltransferase family protein, partial [Acidobacteriota bacterium]|nr:nucleotidyltransferase family protein [Acidobacteriota bacterium]
MSDLQSTRLLVLCARPGDDAGGRSEALRAAAAVRDWDRTLAKAGAEGVLPLLYWALRDDPGAVPSAVLETLRLAFLRNLARTSQVYRELERFLESVRRSGFRAALTKGGRLALDAYADTALRPFWDVDFIVHPADWPGLRRILDGLGFTEASNGGGEDRGGSNPGLEWTYSPYFRKGPLVLEFHGSPL